MNNEEAKKDIKFILTKASIDTVKRQHEKGMGLFPVQKTTREIMEVLDTAINKAVAQEREKVLEQVKDWVNTSQKTYSDKWNHKILMSLWNFLSELQSPKDK